MFTAQYILSPVVGHANADKTDLRLLACGILRVCYAPDGMVLCDDRSVAVAPDVPHGGDRLASMITAALNEPLPIVGWQIVMGLEVSRLARNNADWHRLLEICALADTLILDEDGVFDPANFNDRLLLGLKGTMSEAELHVIKARLRGGILNKARRGEFRCPLPTGFIYDELGDVVLDPDAQIRELITHFFETFSRVGSSSGGLGCDV